MTTSALSKIPIQSTAGAVPVKNEKGEITMQKVKVNRYVTGKRPDYAPQDSSEDEVEDFIQKEKEGVAGEGAEVDAGLLDTHAAAIDDRRLRRLQRTRLEEDEEDDDRIQRHQRRVLEPEVIGGVSDDERGEADNRESGESEEEDVDEEEVEQRRQLLRERARLRQQEEEVLEVAEDEERGGEAGSEDEESEYEEYTDSEEEEEEAGPRLKPVFVRKKDRVTIQEKEHQLLREKELELEAKRLAEERKAQARKLVEEAAKKELEEKKDTDDAYEVVNTDDDNNDEEEYEAWKLRELRRLKRDKEERDTIEKEKAEAERLRSLTEEERKAEFRSNPRVVTNKAPKGKYKFLQKYYHRGAFFLNDEESVYKRDYSAPTLDDHFDKTILPKVMQVKNFGRSGRTKYTHLVDQDTTSFDSPWAADTAQNLKFFNTKGGGMKQIFENPTLKKGAVTNASSSGNAKK